MLIKLGVRLLIFGAVFFFATRKNPKVLINAKWAMPVVALVFALLNTSLYWALTPVLDLATLGAVGFLMPFIVNMILLVVTVRFFRWDKLPRVHKKVDDKNIESKPLFEINGLMTTLWMAGVLTLAHGVLWFALDYLPTR
jgi:multisubunit Na+/H+ antiporter MnhB subunit